MNLPTPPPLALPAPSLTHRSYFEFVDDGYALHLYNRPEHGLYKLDICVPTAQAARDDRMEGYTSVIHFTGGRRQWRTAFRMARLIKKAHPRLLAVLRLEDVQAVARIDVTHPMRDFVLVEADEQSNPPHLIWPLPHGATL